MKWTPQQVAEIGEMVELNIVTFREGREPLRLPIWAVAVGDEIYVRSWLGSTARWFRRVSDNPVGAIVLDGEELAARFDPLADDSVQDAISAEYLRKYASDEYAAAMVEPIPVAATFVVRPAVAVD